MKATLRVVLSLALLGLFLAVPRVHAAPGTVTVFDFTMNPGGRLDFELNSASATPGNGADFLNVLNVLTVSSGTAPNTVFTIAVISLDNSNANVPLTDFDATRTYSYTIATAANGISGFSAAKIAIDTTGFKNSLQGGSFVILQSTDGKSLILQFRPALLRPFQITNIVLDRTSAPGSDRVALTWNSVVGQLYRIQTAPALNSNAWVDASPEISATTISTTASSDYTTPAPGQQFWRVTELPPHPFGGP